MPRIISGICKGMTLKSVRGTKTRPTADKVKGAVFNILTPRIQDAHFLDLFAGTGQMGLEAISRGAKSAVLIESDRLCIECIRENIVKAGAQNQATVLPADAFHAIQKLNVYAPFDIVYIDPPFDRIDEAFERIALLMHRYRCLSEDAVVILEHPTQYPLKQDVINLKLKRSCQYGSVMVSFYEESTIII